MKNAVMISIRPHWCEKIASGEKTIEVRKTRPKLETPFKCYMYCTKATKLQFWTGHKYSYADDHSHNAFDKCGNGKVIGEFVCDEIYTCDDDTIHAFSHEDYSKWNDFDLYRSCIHPEDFELYANNEWLYGWHISDLVIYDQPKELDKFFIESNQSYDCPQLTPLKRPPQSWCYVEVLE